jgi:hypothetical protein
MNYKDIIKRITGISSPIFGVSWNPENTERDFAKQTITFLEDRRVLYNPSEMESPHHCAESVLQIRQFLTPLIGRLLDENELAKSLRAMRAACRKFLDKVDGRNGDIIRYGAHGGHWASWEFNGAIGELRGVFGIYLAKISVAYGINIEKDLATILPEEDEK